jgi:hypothetical protein
MIAVYSENHAEQINTECGQNVHVVTTVNWSPRNEMCRIMRYFSQVHEQNSYTKNPVPPVCPSVFPRVLTQKEQKLFS